MNKGEFIMDSLTVEQIRREMAADVEAANLERSILYQRVEQGLEPDKLIVNVSYPQDPEYDYETKMVNLILEEVFKVCVKIVGDLVIYDHLPIQKEVKSENGIFSPKFGQKLDDMEPFIDRYRCSCGRKKGKVRENTRCEFCNTLVKYVDDDKKVIHPNLYKNIESMVGGPQI